MTHVEAFQTTGTSPPRPWLTVAETADEFGISEWLVRKQIKCGLLKAVRIGGARGPLRISRESIAAWVDTNEVAPRIEGSW